MIPFVNRLTGSLMWVTDERKEEYLRAGHRLALEPEAKPVEASYEEEPKKDTKKKVVRKASRKKK